PGLFVLGEANFSDHGANRLGASALMQGLADGYFILPLTIGDYLARTRPDEIDPSHPEVHAVERAVTDRLDRLLTVGGKRTATEFHKQLGSLIWEYCGMARSAAGLREALERIPALRAEFWADVRVPGSGAALNQSLEYAGRVADFLEFAELMCIDALERDESCGAHFRIEHQTGEGEAKRNDEDYAYVTVWEYTGDESAPAQHREPLHFEHVPLTQRSYK
ncbi:MAG: fumarate reductase/succinate dehydrogenase flavoprotein subunit, partial [Longimicrobiales bacterium]